MKKGIVIFVIVLVALAAVGVAVWQWIGGHPIPPNDGRPNILFISIDSLRADHLSCYGYPKNTSPHLDALAKEGGRFERALSCSPWTLPSHVTMVTGQEPSVHNVRSDNNAIAPNAMTLPKILQRAGYATFGIGSAPYLKARFGFAQGFDVYDDELGSISHKQSHGAETAGKAVDKALAAIKKRRGQRWYGFLHIWDVHYDYLPPEPYDKQFADPEYRRHFPMKKWEKNRSFRVGMNPDDFAYVISQYDGEIAWVDSQLGRLFARLKEWGLWDQTAVMVVADHGDEFLDHGQKGHGHTLFDELIHVPMIVRVPGLAPGAVAACPVSLVDVLPSLASWAKVRNPGYNGPGRDVTALLTGSLACDGNREYFAETRMSNLDKLHAYKRGYEMMLEVGLLKFHNRVTAPMRQLLFDVGADPHEQHDLLGDRPEDATELEARMRRHSRHNATMLRQLRLSERRGLDQQTQQQLKDLGYIQ